MGEMSSVTIDAESLRRTVAEAQKGDRVAADRLIRQHEGWVRSAIYAVTGRGDVVDDIAQQVWLRVWQRLGTLEHPRQLRSWLYTIARRTAIDFCMARKRQAGRTGDLDERVSAPDGPRVSPFRAAARDETQQAVLEGVRSLPAIYREPLVLRHLENWSYAEIGQALGISVEAVETRLVRARRMLREMLQGKVEQ